MLSGLHSATDSSIHFRTNGFSTGVAWRLAAALLLPPTLGLAPWTGTVVVVMSAYSFESNECRAAHHNSQPSAHCPQPANPPSPSKLFETPPTGIDSPRPHGSCRRRT